MVVVVDVDAGFEDNESIAMYSVINGVADRLIRSTSIVIRLLGGVWLVPVGVVLPINSPAAAAVVASRGCTVRFVSRNNGSMMSYQQQQQQHQAAHASPQVAAYQQYGSVANPPPPGVQPQPHLPTGTEGMISYPTAHLYQNNATSSQEYYEDAYFNNAWQAMPAAELATPAISDPVTKAVVDNILGKLPTKKNQVMHRCDVCEQDFSGRSVLDTHLAGAKHAKKLKSIDILNQLAASGQNFSKAGLGGNLRCEACGVDANSSQQLQTHLAGNKHKQRMLKLGGKMPPPSTPPTAVSTLAATAAALMPPPPTPGPAAPTTSSSGAAEPTAAAPPAPMIGPQQPERFFCEVCQCHLNSSIQMQQHVESKKHKDKEAGRNNSAKHHPYRRGQARFSQSNRSGGKKKKQPLAFLTPLSSSFVPGSML